ncbi:ABC-2 transporter permease [Paenibacillus dauci]|uniref:ABC-2 transporter permease n=1 Tax=Paenibacillus dauci TaxID=1567106 RepID=UPI000619BC00|nr:ABC-2 transporter permease [Paenibacillus dauci]
MFDFKNGWVLTRKEISQNRIMFVWAAAFMLYMSLLVGGLYFISIGEVLDSGMIDFIMLISALMLGTDYSRRAFRMMREDMYTELLAYYRTLPIPFAAVLGSRLQQMIIMFIYNWVIFFTIVYGFGARHIPNMTLSGYLAFALSWGGIGLLLLSVYIYWEFTTNYKQYRTYNLIVLVVLIIVGAVGTFTHNNISGQLLRISVEDRLGSPIVWILLAAGIAAMFIAFWWTDRKAKKRDLM